jgi:TPR repeat protein
MASLASLSEWYKIRDLFLGENYVDRNVVLALKLARSCNHPDAKWLVEVFGHLDGAFSDRKVREICLGRGEQDVRALCFGALSCHPLDVQRLTKSAESYAYAQARLAMHAEAGSRFVVAEKGVKQEERDAFHWFGYCHHVGDGTERNVEVAKSFYSRSAQLGFVFSMCEVMSFCWSRRTKRQ